MKYIKTMLLVALLSMVVTVGYSRRGRKEDRRPNRGHNPEMMEGNGRKSTHRRNMELINRLTGMEDIIEKYDIQIRRVFLDAKEEMMGVRIQIRKDVRALRNLNKIYKKNPSRYQMQLYKNIKKLTETLGKKDDLRHKAMEKIKKINDKKDKEIKKAIETWLKKAKNNKTELNKFSEIFEELYER